MYDDPDERGVEMKRWQYTNLVDWLRNVQRSQALLNFFAFWIFWVVVLLPVARHFGWINPAWDYWR